MQNREIKNRKAVFVIGTDTEVGKTLVTGLLARYLLDRGVRVITQKWVQTGSKGLSPDIAAHLELMGTGRRDIDKYLSCMAPYVFGLAASPHLAAEVENEKINAGRIKDCFFRLSEEFEFVIVEGTGGALVPLDREKFVIDIAVELVLPAIIVVKNKLGAINHTILTIEALKSRGIEISGIVLNGQRETEDEAILQDNPKIITELTGVKVLGSLPWSKEVSILHEAFIPIGNNILAQLTRQRQDE